MATISIIAAVDKNGVIGKDNKLPWHIPEDLAWFKANTMNKPIIMGRKTHESIGKRLPGRLNLVISNNRGYASPHKHVYVYNSLVDAISDYEELNELMIIGGAELYTSAFSFVDRLYLTKIHAQFDGDTYFPEYNEIEWEIKESNIVSNQDYEVEFLIMERIA